MHPTVCLASKVETLKSLETYVFQVAYYFLENEDEAMEAARTALLEQSRDDEFFSQSLIVQHDVMKKTVIKNAIQVKRQSLTGVKRSV